MHQDVDSKLADMTASFKASVAGVPKKKKEKVMTCDCKCKGSGKCPTMGGASGNKAKITSPKCVKKGLTKSAALGACKKNGAKECRMLCNKLDGCTGGAPEGLGSCIMQYN